MTPRGRWAPSPTGDTHLGGARTALVAWLDVRSRGGSLVWRVEDLDQPRVVPGAAERQLDDLDWLGLDWDEGPDRGGPHAPYVQSQRLERYRDAIEVLASRSRLFPCSRSRKDLESIATAPHAAGLEPGDGRPYPATLRPGFLPEDWLARHRARGPGHASLRFLVDSEPVAVEDRLLGGFVERVDLEVGDFVLERRDGVFAYQLAVVVDDLAMGIDTVVRGADLVSSTARQIQLIRALGASPPTYGHVPLLVNEANQKLSKRDRSLSLQSLRAAGVDPRLLVGYLGWSLGLLERLEACRPDELIRHFAWGNLRREPWRISDELGARLARPA